MKKIYILAIVFIVFLKNTQAQENRREEIESFRIAYFTKQLNLTPEEAKKFWPVYNEMQALCEGDIDPEELLLVKNYLIGTLLGDLDGPFHIIARWKNLVLNGLDDSFFYHSVDTIKNISAEELKAMANKYLQPEDFYELVVV